MTDEGDATLVSVVTDLSITGKVAQFGRGVLADVSSKLMGQFVENLERDVLSSRAGGEDSGAAEPEPTAEPGTIRSGEPVPERPVVSEVRVVESRDVEPIDLLDVAGDSAAKRLIPVGIGLLLLIVLWRVLRGGRS